MHVPNTVDPEKFRIVRVCVSTGFAGAGNLYPG